VDFDLTRGAKVGDVAYIAPEQALDSHAVDARADIYSLGATFYLALVGRAPAPGAGIRDADLSRRSDTTEFSRLMAVLRRMTALDPADRYQTAAEVAAELAVWAMPTPPMAIEVPPIESDPDVESDSDASLVPDAEKCDTDSGLPATPLAFDMSAQNKPRKISRAKIPKEPWWRERRWQLLILGLGAAMGLLAALVVNAR
jgi:serine/threonine protein kinase